MLDIPPPTEAPVQTYPDQVGERPDRAAPTPMLRWRLIRDTPRRGPQNMALDHALAACLRDGEGVVRLYGWSRPTVSFGKNEPAAPVPGAVLDYVRRPTGGRAVLHDDELTYAVVAPMGALGSLREVFARINEALAAAIRTLGGEARLAGGDERGGGSDVARALPPDAGPCFDLPARGEIVSQGRKLVGSAQARLEGVLLQHGSILLGGNQRLLGSSSTDPMTLGELLQGVDRVDVEEAVAVALARSLGGSWGDGGYGVHELEAAERFEAERYGRDEWTWRRLQECT